LDYYFIIRVVLQSRAPGGVFLQATRITPGILPSALRASLRLFKIAPGDFVCPSCGARRMVESAAHLVDHVLPEQPIRHVGSPPAVGLTFPYSLRFLFAAQPQVLSQVLGVVYRAISTYLIKKTGFTVASGTKTGAVTLIQRFGSALNLNIHFHMLFLDGVYTFKGPQPRFHRAPRPTPTELARLLHTISRRVAGSLERQGLLVRDPESDYLDLGCSVCAMSQPHGAHPPNL
jgi:hypothetical protein